MGDAGYSDASPDADPAVQPDAARQEGGDAAPAPPTRHVFQAEVWADNWFAAYLGNSLIMEDSVPITTERSFNAERFSFEASYPFTLNFLVKDYMQDESGLEYIGLPNQQMGDGGFIAQVRDVGTGARILVTSSAWRCLVLQRAPLDPSCEHDPVPTETCEAEATMEPSGWKSPGFDSGAFPFATVFTAAEVGPKEGYDEIDWDPQAQLIWGDDLETVNTLACTVTVEEEP